MKMKVKKIYLIVMLLLFLVISSFLSNLETNQDYQFDMYNSMYFALNDYVSNLEKLDTKTIRDNAKTIRIMLGKIDSKYANQFFVFAQLFTDNDSFNKLTTDEKRMISKLYEKVSVNILFNHEENKIIMPENSDEVIKQIKQIISHYKIL